MHVTRYDISSLSDAQIALWDKLLLNSEVSSPFLSYGFCRAVDDVRGGVRVLHLHDHESEAFLPYQIRRGRGLLGHAEKVGGTMSDWFGAAGRVVSRIDSARLLDGAGLSSLRFDHACEPMCPFAIEEPEKQTGVRVRAQDFERFLADRQAVDKYFLKSVSRAEKQLSRDVGEICFRWHSDNQSRDLNRLIVEKREQYRRSNRTGGLDAAWQLQLLHTLVSNTSSSNCRAVLSTLHCGSGWIASNLSLACGNLLHIWFPVYDPTFRRYGPGHILFLKIIESGIHKGYTIFDFGQGEAAYKKKYGGEIYVLWKGAITGNSVMGYAERVLQSLEWRISRYRRRNDAGSEERI